MTAPGHLPIAVPRYKAILFDLDNCLCDAREAGESLFEPAFAAIAAANRGHLPEPALRAAFDECWYSAFDVVAQRHGFSDAMVQAGLDAFRRVEVGGALQGYPDLPVLPTLPVERHLVTSGFHRLQSSKVRALGIGHWFAAVHIDAVDVPPQRGKQAIFGDILRERGFDPGEVLVVGDNPLSELRAGRALGMPTVQTLRPGVARADADFHIGRLDQLFDILEGRVR